MTRREWRPHNTRLLSFTFSASRYICPPISLNFSLILAMPSSMVPDIDIPTAPDEKQTSPDDVHQSTTAALKSNADGVILSRKYSEMKLANLAAAGRAVKEVPL